MDHRPVPISRRALLRIATLTPLIAVPAAGAKRALAADTNPAAAQRPGHIHRTIIGVI